MNGEVYIEIRGGIHVCVPNNVRLLTHYVLREQEDWFEDEIDFVRKFLKPGMNVVDIGANYGIYTLTSAQLIGKDGRIWAFEPSSTTARLLAKSINANKIENAQLIQAGLSDKHGHSSLVLNPNTEMCFLSDDPDETGQKERVELYSLDECREKYGWHSIDLIKMDAEGHESKIIKGGDNLLASSSPLVMYEIRAGNKVNLNLLREFEQLDYKSYVLIPGLNILAPFDSEDAIDDYLLNLFCCKEDRATDLEQRGLLVRKSSESLSHVRIDIKWPDYLRQFPFGRHFFSAWNAYNGTPDNEEQRIYQTALNYYASSKNSRKSANLRYASLYTSFELMNSLDLRSTDIARLVSFVRISSDLGCRAFAVQLLRKLISAFNNKQPVQLTEPFLPLSFAMESAQPGENIGNWLFSAILETFEKSRSYSSYYTGRQSLELLELIKQLGYPTPEMERRRQLLMICSDRQTGPHCSPVLSEKSDNNLNPDYWCSR